MGHRRVWQWRLRGGLFRRHVSSDVAGNKCRVDYETPWRSERRGRRVLQGMVALATGWVARGRFVLARSCPDKAARAVGCVTTGRVAVGAGDALW